TVLGRRSERPPSEMINSLAASQSPQPSFRVVLDFEHDGVAHRVTRQLTATPSPEEKMIVERDDVALSEADSQAVMLAVAPPSLSQFFLFDGELLRQYEDLRDPDIDSGRVMREEV